MRSIEAPCIHVPESATVSRCPSSLHAACLSARRCSACGASAMACSHSASDTKQQRSFKSCLLCSVDLFVDFAAILVRLIIILVRVLSVMPILEAKVCCEEYGTVVQTPLVLKPMSIVPCSSRMRRRRRSSRGSRASAGYRSYCFCRPDL